MKRLVVCCDGTWNDADSTQDFTNVARMSRAVNPVDDRATSPVSQIVYYQSGIGSAGDTTSRLVAGAVGLGLSHNVRDAYAFLVNNFCEGDEVFLFGFSRGAYTARSVAGLIGWAGLLHKADMDDFASVWESYRLRDRPGQSDARVHFADRHANVPIKVVGVWDTVGALGIPGNIETPFSEFFQFLDTKLGPHVENGFHALALDEHRSTYAPTLWTRQADAPASQVLVQTWFAGAHSNVGGGYSEHGLSDVTLAWMCSRVEPFLGLDVGYLEARQDRRNAWGLGRIYDSASGLFSLLSKAVRTVSPGVDGQSIHASVEVRRAGAVPRYAPANLPPPAPAAALGELETRLRWPAADPSRTGQTDKPKATFVSQVLGTLGGP